MNTRRTTIRKRYNSLEEVKKVIKSLKNNQSSRPGGIPQKLVKHGTKKLLRMINQMFQKVTKGKDLPKK